MSYQGSNRLAQLAVAYGISREARKKIEVMIENNWSDSQIMNELKGLPQQFLIEARKLYADKYWEKDFKYERNNMGRKFT